MFRGGIRLGRVFGININIDVSWFLVFLLVTFDLALGIFPALHPEWSVFLSWGVGILASVLFFASVLTHEIAHSLVARARGLPVSEITLFIFGGVSNIQREPASSGSEFLIAVVGPLTSIVLGIVLSLLGGLAIRGMGSLATNPASVLAGLNPISTLLLWLGPINILLGVFNLIPAFPLDGGRVLRSFFWAISKNLKEATRYASLIGQAFGWLFIAAGIIMALGIGIPFLGAGLISGLWLVFLGWFLTSLASQGYQQVVMETTLKDVSVSAIMRTKAPQVGPEISVGSLVHEHIMGTEDRAFPVMEKERLVGLVTLDDVRKAPQSRWQSMKVREIMTPADELETVGPNDKAIDALQKIAGRDVNQLPVLEEGRLVGLLSRRDILLWLQTHGEDEKIAEGG